MTQWIGRVWNCYSVVTLCAIMFSNVAMAQNRTAGVSKAAPHADVTFDNSCVSDAGKQRKLTVNVNGVLKRVDAVQNDAGSTWTVGGWTVNVSASVAFNGLQKAAADAKKYSPRFSGKAGPLPGGGGGGGGGVNQDYEWDVDGEYTVVGIEFDEVKICADKIKTTLSPVGLTGAFTLKLLGGATVTLVNGANRSGGTTYTDSFDVGNLPDSKSFTKLEATWQGCTVEYPYPFEVLEDYRITVYNTPLEDDFAGGSTQVKTVTGSGAWSARTYKTDFLDEVVENGSGKGSDGVIITLEFYFVPGNYHGFPPPAGLPPQYDSPNSTIDFDFRRPSSVKGATGNNIITDVSVAVKPGHPKLSIDGKVYVEDLGCKTIDDHGGGLAIKQLDLYKGFGDAAVAGWTNPYKKVIKLP